MNEESLLEFPCDFPLKVMGRKEGDFEAVIVELVEKQVGPLARDRVRQRESRDGNFIALTVLLRAESQAQLDAVYAALSAHEQVLMVL